MKLKTCTALLLCVLPLDGLLAEKIKFKIEGTSSLPIYAVERPESRANIIAIIGGQGLRNKKGKSKNYLVRQRNTFTEKSINFYLLPNRSHKEKASYPRRASVERSEAIRVLVEEIGRRNGLPVFVVGFSRGTVDAGAYAKRYPETIAGIVLASGIYTNTSYKAWDYSMEIVVGKKIKVPVLIAHHVEDECRVTEFGYAKAFFDQLAAPRKNILSYTGGNPSGRQCGPYHYHGFEGIEREVATGIADWVVLNSGN